MSIVGTVYRYGGSDGDGDGNDKDKV